MPDANDWNEARLLALIRDRIEESAELEYKGGGALRSDQKAKEEITKDVSSIANADGGTLIYGIAEYRDESRKHLPEKIDPVDRLQFSREWLDQIISQIRPRIEGLRIVPVPLSSGPNDVAYVVEIPKGATAHQALTLHYHRRYNFEALRMLDHEIRDVMNRRAHPKIKVSARLIIYPQSNREGEAGRLQFTLENDSDVLARFIKLTVNAPIKIKGQIVAYVGDWIMDDCEGGLGYVLISSNHLGAPLFPRSKRNAAFDFKLVHKMEMRELKPLSEFYHYTVYADAMPPVCGKFATDEIFEKIPDKGAWKSIENAGLTSNSS